MTGIITGDVELVKQAYDRGDRVRVDRASEPKRFRIGGLSNCNELNVLLGGDWWVLTADEFDDLCLPKTTPTQINTIQELADFIQSGGGDCHIGSMTFDRETALKLQESGSSIIRDSEDQTRHTVCDCGYSLSAYDLLFGGDWRAVTLRPEKKEPQQVNFFASLSNPDAHRYDVENLRVILDNRTAGTLDRDYGGDWRVFSGVTSQDIAKFAAKAKEQDIEIY